VKHFSLVLIILGLIFFSACIHQTIHNDVTFLEGHRYEDVWTASIRAVNDINFAIHSTDYDAGFIGAESGPNIGQDAYPQLSVMISESKGRIYVECKVLQKEQFVDILGHGRRTIRNFMTALNVNLNHRM